MIAEPSDDAEVVTCPSCGKGPDLCVCATIEPFANRVEVLFLQHPQEQDRELGTAKLARLHFENAGLKAGLSWQNLSSAVGRSADPNRWAVLYLGSTHTDSAKAFSSVIAVLDRHGKAADQKTSSDVLTGLEGIILLDGSWSQAKTLWWRNPWLLKCWRIALNPSEPSLYGRTRREPRRESLSTLEAAAIVMAELERNPEIQARLFSSFRRLLQQYRLVRAPKGTAPQRRSGHVRHTRRR